MKNEEFCIKNEELCITNEELCIKMLNFTVLGWNVPYLSQEGLGSHGNRRPR